MSLASPFVSYPSHRLHLFNLYLFNIVFLKRVFQPPFVLHVIGH